MRTFHVLLTLALAVSQVRADEKIDAEYPGGNIRVVSRDSDGFTLAPDLRDTKGWWFYFNFRLRDSQDEPVTIRFEEPNPIGVRGPAASTDGGMTWNWLGADAVSKSERDGRAIWSFQAKVPKGASEIRYAFAPQYLDAHLKKWLDANAGNANLQVGELCRSRQGQSVPLLRAGCLDEKKVRGFVLLTSRHHACEMIATYSLEGILSAALADDDVGRRWRERWQIVAAPFIDKDGVEAGDQGKNRAPHDHNRDYNAQPIYPEVVAWMKLGESLGSRVAFTLDMHCPSIRGEWNDRVYLVGAPTPAMAEKDMAFAAAIERVAVGTLPFHTSDGYLAAGTAWNRPSTYTAGRTNANWSRDTFPQSHFCGTIEISYADAFGSEVNADSARALGRRLAHAILDHLER